MSDTCRRPPAPSLRGRSKPLSLVATPDDEGLRLDRFIRKRSGVLSRVRARDLLEAGGVFVNGRRVKIFSKPLRAGDRVEIYPLPEEHRSNPPPGMDPFRVVHEDTAVILVDKAPGVLVQPTPQGDRGTLVDLLGRYLRKKSAGSRKPYLGLIHRIDRETSGLLLFSRRGAANRILTHQFRAHSIQREYLALVHGQVPGERGTITNRLVRPSPSSRRTTTRSPTRGKSAVTHFRVLERFSSATLLRVRLETGRTHQIRIHFSGKGHPVVGDKVYGLVSARTAHPILDRFARQALHAARLGFTHPLSGKWMQFETPPPADFSALLEELRSVRSESFSAAPFSEPQNREG